MRLTTEHIARARGLGRSPARGVLAASAVAVLALGLAGPGLAGPATASVDGPGGTVTEGRPGLAPVNGLERGSLGASGEEAEEAGQPEPVAVAVVENPDGSLTVERYETGTVAAASRVAGELAKRTDVVAAEVNHTVTALAVNPSDDTWYSCQWALASSVPASGTPCAGLSVAPNSLKAPTTVWGESDGEGVTVAVLDTGVKADHVDLKGQVLDGVDFVGAASNKGKKDFHGHGTHVAGIVAAADNDRGVVGLAPKAKILPVRVLNASGQGGEDDIADGIIWATDQGADVINMSLGGPERSSIQETAVRYALSKGVLVVASAGNSSASGNPTMYPAAIPGVLAVAATTRSGVRWAASERKAYNAVAAPGDGIVSSFVDDRGWYDDDDVWQEVCPASDGFTGDDCVASLSGTSMAAPYVSATAALLLARQPGLSPAALSAYITGTATDAGSSGRDTWYGFGHLNAGKALGQVDAGSARPTSVGLAPSSTRIKAGTTISLKATVASNGYLLPYRKVAFQRLNLDGSWTTLGTVNTNPSGNASLSVKPSRHTKYRAVAGAVTGLESGKSATQTVAMYAKITRSGSSPSADHVTIKAQAYPKAEVTLKLQRKVSGTWKTISTKTTSSTGAVTFSKVKAPTGKRYFRVIGGKSSLAGDGKSSTLTLTVK